MYVYKQNYSPTAKALSARVKALLCLVALMCGLGVVSAVPSIAHAQTLEAGGLTAQAVSGVQRTIPSGEVNVSSLFETVGPLDTIKLTGDTVLVLDTDFICAGIDCKDGGNYYDLTIQGTGSLTINNNGDFAYGIQQSGDVTIESGTVSIAVAGDGIDSNGDVTISGGTVSILGLSSDGMLARTAILANGEINIDNASVYCKGEICTNATTGNGVTIGSNAKLTVIREEDYGYGPIYVTGRGDRTQGEDTFNDSVNLRINGTKEPSTAHIDDKWYKANIVLGEEDPDNGVYYCVIMDGESFATELKVNGGAPEAAVKKVITEDMVTGIENKMFTGSQVVQTPVIKDGGYTLKENTDYKLLYSPYANIVDATQRASDAPAVFIVGIGKYAYMNSKTFMILPAAVTPEFSLRTAFVYDGEPHQPSVSAKVVYNGETYWLSRPTDFVITYNDDCIDVGTHKAIMTNKGGNFTFETTEREFRIVREDEPIRVTPAFGLKPSSYVYDGTVKTPTVIAKVDGVALIKGEDYDVVFDDGRIDIGTYKVTITRVGGPYDFDTEVLTFTINSEAGPTKVTPTFSLSESSYTYDGKAKTPTAIVKVGSTTLVKDTDYTVTYAAGRTNVGTYKVTVAPKGSTYTFDSKTLEFKINAKQVTPTVTLDKATYTYDGKAKAPKVIVKDGSTTLVEGTDYTLATPSGRTNVGAYTYTATCKGNYSGKATAKLTINKATVKVAIPTGQDRTFNGKAQTGVAAGANYTLSGISSATNAGTYTATATLKTSANYLYKWSDGTTAPKTVSWKMSPAKVTPSIKLAATSYTWDGKAKAPAVTVKVGKSALKKGADYVATYAKGRKDVGKYTVKVAAKGNYSFAAKTLSFVINPKGTSAKAPAASKRALTVKWAKQAKKMSSSTVTGYQVQVATDKAFKKNLKKVIVKGFEKTSVKVFKLKSKTVYYVRVRTYKAVGKATYYSSWSTYKKAVKTK